MRPGWSDNNGPDEHKPVFLQADQRRSGGSQSDGSVSRRRIARVLVASLASSAAGRMTFELIAERGAEPDNLDSFFAALEADAAHEIDGVRDEANKPISNEPQRVHDDLNSLPTR